MGGSIALAKAPRLSTHLKQREPDGGVGRQGTAEQDLGASQTWELHWVILNRDASDILLSANPTLSSSP